MSPWRFFETNTASDLTGGFANRKVLIAAPGTTTQGVTIPGNSTREIWFFTEPEDPRNADWPDGDFTVKVRFTIGDTNLRVSTKIARLNSAGTLQQESAATAEQTPSAGTLTFNHSGLTWTAGASNDRLCVKILVRNTVAQSKNCTLGLGAETDYIDTPFLDLSVTEAMLRRFA